MSIRNFCKATQLLYRVHCVQRVSSSNDAVIQGVANKWKPNEFNVDPDWRSRSTSGEDRDQSHLMYIAHEHKKNDRQRTPIAGLAMTLAFTFNFFKMSTDDEDNDPEQKLVDTIKRSILCIQREQYDKAEQMLHLALRMAQDIQSKDGVTYIYDLMANLAMEREQFKKAEKIFADVMKRLFADGYTEESTKILHISSKIAHMSQLQGDLEKAHQGFIWTLGQLAKIIEKMPDDRDVQELFGLTKNWFGQLLMKEGNYKEAKKLFKEAYDCLVNVYGAVNDASVTILNNISVAYVNLENYAEARENLMQAMAIAKDLDDPSQEGVLQANLGLIYLREGLLQQAKEACKLAWQMGKRHNNADAIEQAEYCLSELKSTMKT